MYIVLIFFISLTGVWQQSVIYSILYSKSSILVHSFQRECLNNIPGIFKRRLLLAMLYYFWIFQFRFTFVCILKYLLHFFVLIRLITLHHALLIKWSFKTPQLFLIRVFLVWCQFHLFSRKVGGTTALFLSTNLANNEKIDNHF